MKLPAERIEEFARVMGRPRWAETIPPDDYSKCRVVIDDDRIVAATLVVDDGTNWYLMTPQGDRHFFSFLLTDVTDVAAANDISQVHVRFDESLVDGRLIRILEMAGYHKAEHRRRFRLQLEDCSAEDFSGDDRLSWKNLDDVGLAEAGRMMERVAEGDPAHDPDENGPDALKAYLQDPVLSSRPDSVQIGFIGDEPVAFLCAQVNPRSGWGRITYMGVVPEYRGQGLGREVHRHGLGTLCHQGCRLYEGGTEVENSAMLRVFAASGCHEFEGEYGFTWQGK